MLKHTEIGLIGEQIAVVFLKNKGYEIIDSNYRYSHYEIDIIAKYANWIVFIEVKTRKNVHFGFPEEAVSTFKKNAIKIAAAAYYEEKSMQDLNIRFDIISLIYHQGAVQEIKHIEDAFF